MLRKRGISAALIALVIATGLLSRHWRAYMPHEVNLVLGDALWALMVYLMVRFALIGKSIRTVFLISLAFCYAIELSQLYHSAFIDGIRSTTLGGLVLGYGFLWSDLLAYLMGASAGAAVEWVFRHE